MNIIIILIVSIFWGLVGVLVKTASFMFDSWIISFCRFFFGIVFLGLLMLFKEKKLSFVYDMKWIWIGAIGKCINYMSENMALKIGHAYENILVSVFQTLLLIVASVVVFNEKMNVKKAAASVLCVAGVFLISWNGLPFAVVFSSGITVKVLFLVSAVGAGLHSISQKKLIENMDAGKMNFSVFVICSAITALPLPFGPHPAGAVNYFSIVSLILLGLITGVSFYFYAIALRKVPFLYAILISNATVLFSLMWSKLIFDDPITGYIVTGALLFVAGVILLNLPRGFSVRKAISARFEAGSREG